MTRRARTRISAALLVAGTAAFWASLGMRAVTRPAYHQFIGSVGTELTSFSGFQFADGWMWFVQRPETAFNAAFLATAFLFWGGVVWFRSAWARFFGAAAAAVSAVVAVVRLRFEGAEPSDPCAGWWSWITASLAICAAFLVLPVQVRPPPGESLTREEVDLGRSRLAWIIGVGASLLLLGSHLLLVASPFAPYGDALGSWIRASGFVFEEELPQLARIDPTMSLAAKSLGSDPTQWSEGLWLLLPFVFVTVATVRRRFWRSVGVVWAAGLAFVELKWTSVPWQEDYVSPCPAEFLWYGPPIALLAAFLLLPPRREAVTPAA